MRGGDKDRDDLYAATPPLEGIRLLLSRAATKRQDGRRRKLIFIDAKKAHLNYKHPNEIVFDYEFTRLFKNLESKLV